jgi:hypothetical protein
VPVEKKDVTEAREDKDAREGREEKDAPLAVPPVTMTACPPPPVISFTADAVSAVSLKSTKALQPSFSHIAFFSAPESMTTTRMPVKGRRRRGE